MRQKGLAVFRFFGRRIRILDREVEPPDAGRHFLRRVEDDLGALYLDMVGIAAALASHIRHERTEVAQPHGVPLFYPRKHGTDHRTENGLNLRLVRTRSLGHEARYLVRSYLVATVGCGHIHYFLVFLEVQSLLSHFHLERHNRSVF